MTIAPSGGGISYGTNLYWDPTHSDSATAGGSGDWNTSDAYWYNPATGEDQTWDNSGAYTAIFAGTAGTVTLDTTISADAFSFQSDGYVLNSVRRRHAYHRRLRNQRRCGHECHGQLHLDGSNGLSKIGTGNLIVGGSDNTYTGATSILYGTLTLSSSAALGDSSYVTARPSATLDLNGQIDRRHRFIAILRRHAYQQQHHDCRLVRRSRQLRCVYFLRPEFHRLRHRRYYVQGRRRRIRFGRSPAMAGTNTLILSGSDDNVGLNLVVDSGTVELDKSSSSSVHAVESGLTIDGGTVEFSGTGTEQIDDAFRSESATAGRVGHERHRSDSQFPRRRW